MLIGELGLILSVLYRCWDGASVLAEERPSGSLDGNPNDISSHQSLVLQRLVVLHGTLELLCLQPFLQSSDLHLE